MKRTLLSLIVLVAIQSCTKDDSEPEVKKNLVIATQPATNITPVEAKLNGKITEIGSTNISDHGFMISETSDFSAGSTTTHSLGAKAETGNFSIELAALNLETTYHFKAYAKDDEGEVFGSAASFMTTAPNVTGIEPTEGVAGDEVLISGSDFVIGMKVKFGEIEVEVVSLTTFSIIAIVPAGLGIEPVALSILVDETQFTSTVEFLPIVGKWEQLANFPGVARNLATSFTINGKGYVGLGWGNDQYLRDMWQYDPSNDSWEQLNDFPTEINSTFYVSFSIDGVGYAGISDDANEFWQYDTTDDLWLRVADFPGTATGFYINNFVIQGKAYVGRDFAGDTDAEIWMYDPFDDSWKLKSTYPSEWPSSSLHVSTGIAGYIALGSSRKDVWKYSPSNNIWEQKGDFPAVNSNNGKPTAFYINGVIYAGITSDYPNDGWDTNFWQYDEALDSWDQLSNFPFSPEGGGVNMVIDGNAYIGLGNNGTTSFYKFTPPSE